MNDSAGYIISKENCEHHSHLKCSTRGPLESRSFHSKGKKKKKESIKSLVFCTETNTCRKQIFNSPTSLFCKGWRIYNGIFQKKLHSSHAGADAFSIRYYSGSCVLPLDAATTQEWYET